LNDSSAKLLWFCLTTHLFLQDETLTDSTESRDALVNSKELLLHSLEAKSPVKNPKKRETKPVATEISTIFAEMK
jgi:hypothetical protein